MEEKIYITGIQRDANEFLLRTMFEKVGIVVGMEVFSDHAITEFESKTSVSKAISKFDGTKFEGHKIFVFTYNEIVSKHDAEEKIKTSKDVGHYESDETSKGDYDGPVSDNEDYNLDLIYDDLVNLLLKYRDVYHPK